MINILHITPDFNYSCGRSKLVYLYLKHFSNHNDYKVHFITNDGDSLDRIKEFPSLNFKKLNFNTDSKNIFNSIGFYRSLKEFSRKNDIELIHTHHRLPEYITSQISKRLKIKTVTTAHSFVKGFKKISFRSDRIICVSKAIADQLINEFNINPERLTVIYNPVDKIVELDNNEKEKFRGKLGINDDKQVILFMGRLNEDKGYDTLLKSFEFVYKKNKEALLLMSGNIEDKNFHSYSYQKNENIKIFVPSSNSLNLYSIADLVVLPSRIEPFPFVMLESGSFKKPFIGGNTGGIAEFIEDGINGLLVDPENPEQLSEKIIYLLNNPDKGKLMGENLYSKVNRLCNIDNYFSQVEKIYNSLLTSK